MSLQTESNQYGLRSIVIEETVTNPYATGGDALRISGNVTLPEHTAHVTIIGPRGAMKAAMLISLDDLAQLGAAASAMAAELKASRP